MVVDLEKLNKIWREILLSEVKTWVIFKHGTCVVCSDPGQDPREYATNLMKTLGIVVTATSHGDFTVHPMENVPGWVVVYHHKDILSYVSPSDMEEDAGDLAIGLFGRHNRGEDAKGLQIIHVEGV